MSNKKAGMFILMIGIIGFVENVCLLLQTITTFKEIEEYWFVGIFYDITVRPTQLFLLFSISNLLVFAALVIIGCYMMNTAKASQKSRSPHQGEAKDHPRPPRSPTKL